MELDDDSKDLTTFQTPYGRYCVNRMPFGISSASEVMQKKGYQMFGDIPGVHIIVVFIPNKAELTEPLRQLVKDGVPFTWGRAQKEATKRIKAVLS